MTQDCGPQQPETAQVLRPYGVGIDTHCKFIAVCVLRTQGDRVLRTEKEFATSWPELLAARQWVEQELGPLVDSGNPLRYCIELTGTYHMPVIRAMGGVPSVVNPLLAGPTRRKTDVLDARLLAHHSITGLWPESFMPSPSGQQLRILWAQRADAMRTATRCGNRLNNIVLRFGHTFGADSPIRSLCSQGIIEELVAGSVPALPNVCPDGVPEAVRPVLAELLDQLRNALQAARSAEARAVAFVRANKWPAGGGQVEGRALLELLMTVPGVGIGTAMTWLAEVCDPTRFRCAEQVAAYCGCDPSLKVSAGKVTCQVRRKGNTRLHFALLHAAAPLMSRRSEAVGQWGASIMGRHKKGGHRKARSAVARRLAAGLWHVHRTGKPFSYEQYFRATPIDVPVVAVEDMGLGRASKVLRSAGLVDSPAVLSAYLRGELATVSGCGDKTLAVIRQWASGRRMDAQAQSGGSRRVYNLKPPEYASLARPARKETADAKGNAGRGPRGAAFQGKGDGQDTEAGRGKER